MWPAFQWITCCNLQQCLHDRIRAKKWNLSDLFVLSCLSKDGSCHLITRVCFSACQSVLQREAKNVNSGQQHSTCPDWENWLRFIVCLFVLASRTEREQHGNPRFKISCSSFFPPSLLASPIKALMLFTLSILWPPFSASVLRLSSPSVSNSSFFIETNRLEVTPGRAADESWLLRSTQSDGFSFASKTRWYSFVAMAPNFLLAWSAKLCESLRGLLNGDVQPEFKSAVWCCFPPGCLLQLILLVLY